MKESPPPPNQDLVFLSPFALAAMVAEQFSTFPQVEAIALAGSLTSENNDKNSDIDLYIYTKEVIPLPLRKALIEGLGTTKADYNLLYWDLGDEWYHAETGIEVDMIYWHPSWIEKQIERVLTRHQASLGYSTCFWHTILHSQPLFDRNSWFQALQNKCQQTYPEGLRQAIIRKNHAVLRDIIPSYRHQIEKAIRRNDLVSLNHRVAALLASYFDIIFALNYQPNPGEKRLIDTALKQCKLLPEQMAEQVNEVLREAATADHALLFSVDSLIDGLEDVIAQEGFEA
jgi:predicted nucleotidyltransferase